MTVSPRRLGWVQTTSLVTGNLIGSGVFLLPASLAIFGALSLIGWILTGIGALFLAVVFALLSQITQKSGGPHVYIEKAFGREAAFWTAWGYWVLSWIGNAALIVAAISYLAPLMGGLSSKAIFGMEVAILGAITLVNVFGIQFAGRFELIMTLLKLLPLVGIPLMGIFSLHAAELTAVPSHLSAWEGIKSAMFLCVWAFIGLETATVPAEEVMHAKKTVPLATVLGTVIALGVYLLGAVVLLGHLGAAKLASSPAPYADLATALFGGNWGMVIALAACLCAIGSFHGWTIVVSRIASSASDQGLFPKILGGTDKRGTPVNGLYASSLCTLPLLWLSLRDSLTQQFHTIIDISITLILFVYLAAVLAFFKLHGLSSLGKSLVGIGAGLFVCFALWSAKFVLLGSALLFLLLGIIVRMLPHTFFQKRS